MLGIVTVFTHIYAIIYLTNCMMGYDNFRLHPSHT